MSTYGFLCIMICLIVFKCVYFTQYSSVYVMFLFIWNLFHTISQFHTVCYFLSAKSPPACQASLTRNDAGGLCRGWDWWRGEKRIQSLPSSKESMTAIATLVLEIASKKNMPGKPSLKLQRQTISPFMKTSHRGNALTDTCCNWHAQSTPAVPCSGLAHLAQYSVLVHW